MLQVTIIGNLGDDAKVIDCASGKFYSFSVAHSDRYKDSNGTTIERTQWVNVSYNYRNEGLLQYLKKGCKVFCQGKPRFAVYTNELGRQSVSVSLFCDTLTLCGSKLEDK